MTDAVAHTPAPWEFHDDYGTWQVVDTDNRPICLIRHGRTDEERQLANAHLITAAPELLAVVKGILSQAGSSIDTEWLERASLAIAQAEGRQP